MPPNGFRGVARPRLPGAIPIALLCSLMTVAGNLPAAHATPRRLPPGTVVRPPPEAFVKETRSGRLGARVVLSTSREVHVGESVSLELTCVFAAARTTGTVDPGEGACAAWRRGAVQIDVEMPEHGHGLASPAAIRVEEVAGGRRAVLAPVRMHMPGWWRVVVAVVDGGTAVDWAVFHLAVPL